MSKFISSADALADINSRLQRPISRQQFATVYALMAANDDATPPQPRQGGWVLMSELWKWGVYLATRERLIDAGKWSRKRPYSVADMEDIAIRGMYED